MAIRDYQRVDYVKIVETTFASIDVLLSFVDLEYIFRIPFSPASVSLNLSLISVEMPTVVERMGANVLLVEAILQHS